MYSSVYSTVDAQLWHNCTAKHELVHFLTRAGHIWTCWQVMTSLSQLHPSSVLDNTETCLQSSSCVPEGTSTKYIPTNVPLAFSFLTSADTSLAFIHLYTEHAPLSRTCSAKSLHCLVLRKCNICQNLVCRPTLWYLNVKNSPDCCWHCRGKGPVGTEAEMSEVFASIHQGAGHHAGAGWREKADHGEIIWQYLVGTADWETSCSKPKHVKGKNNKKTKQKQPRYLLG